ncbi:MAG: hypothetical protein ACXV2E_05975 [Halobacteriota archaeon]
MNENIAPFSLDNDGEDHVCEEITRKHEHNFERWNAIDAKIGIILGFTVVVIFQVILGGDINGFIRIHPASVIHQTLDYLAFDLFLSGIVCLVTASIIGLNAFRVRGYRETDVIEWKWLDKYKNNDIDGYTFRRWVIQEQARCSSSNEGIIRLKAEGLRTMSIVLFCGIGFFLARFTIELMSIRVT